MRRSAPMICAVCVAFAAPSFGQDFPRTEIFGSGGWAQWWDDEGLSIRGATFGGGVGRRLLPQFAIEAEVNAFSPVRRYPGSPYRFQARGLHVVGNGVLYVVRNERAHVFVLLGAGATHSTTEDSFLDVHYRRSGNGFVANAGTGMKIFLSRHVALRPEARITAGSTGSSVLKGYGAELRVSLGLGYHW